VTKGLAIATRGDATAPREGPQIDLVWQAPKTLALHYERTARIFKKLETIAGVSILYPL